MFRISLFLVTNLAVLVVLSTSMRLLGVDRYLESQGMQFVGLLIFAFIFGMAGSLVSLFISKWSAKRMTGAKVIEQPRSEGETWLLDTVRRQAEQAGIGTPEVAVYDAPEINAFATGANRNKALVAVSTGLLRSMTRDEAEAVLGHEVSHVANGDMITLSLVQGVVNTFVIFLSRVVGTIVDNAISRGRGGYGRGPAYWITVIVAEMILAVLASIIVMWFSRYREFRADAGGAKLAGKQKMIAALRRLQSQHGKPSELPDQMAAFGISGGMGRGLKKLFLSHPPLEQRIAALEQAG